MAHEGRTVATVGAVSGRFVGFLTPYLEEVFLGTGYSLVNSGEYDWLETSSNKRRHNQKPDLLRCHDSIYETRDPFSTNDETLRNMRMDTDKFGVLKDWRLRRCIGATLEATLTSGGKGLAKLLAMALTFVSTRMAMHPFTPG